MPVSAEEHLADISIDARGILDQHGITMDALARQLKAELVAKETKFIKIKGDGVMGLKRGTRVVAQSDDETIVAVDVAALGVRQNARKDAHMLRGDYPDEKHKVEHSDIVVRLVQYGTD